MKQWIVHLAFGLAAAFAGPAMAQYDTGKPAVEGARPAAAPAAAGLPNVQPVDIMNQNQAERSRDQPGNLAPVYRAIKDGEKHYSSLPDPEAGILVQPKAQFPGQARATTAGEAWRQYRNGPLTTYGGWLLLLTVALLAAVYLLRGQVKLSAPRTGRKIERFTLFERTVHWTMAISFVTLAISGLIILFGKYILLPVFGHTLFGWLAFALKNIHNFVGPVFSVAIIVFFITFVKDNLPAASDVAWFARLGGLLGGKHVSAHRFNAGEKIVFWGAVVVLGLIVSASSLVLDMLVPWVEATRANMQIASLVHLTASVLAASMVIGHIYLGTIGMEGAYEAMRTGYVDDTWAKEHHDEWYADVQSGKIPRIRTQEAAGTTSAPPKAV